MKKQSSSLSIDSVGSAAGISREARRRKEKDRAAERRLKLDAHYSDVDIGHIADHNNYTQNYSETADSAVSDGDEVDDFSVLTNSHKLIVPPGKLKEMQRNGTSLDRSSSDQSTGSLLYCKTPTTGGGPSMLGMGGGVTGIMSNLAPGKSSSLIFPTGVDTAPGGGDDDRGRAWDLESAKIKRSKVNFQLDHCEAIRFRFKKKLMLNNLNLSSADIPMKDLCGTALGNSLFKLSLAGNRLGSVPPKLVVSLPALKILDLSQCELHQLPEKFYLPKLTRLNLSNNRFTEFPEEVRCVEC